jgi:hypothetical protein
MSDLETAQVSMAYPAGQDADPYGPVGAAAQPAAQAKYGADLAALAAVPAQGGGPGIAPPVERGPKGS